MNLKKELIQEFTSEMMVLVIKSNTKNKTHLDTMLDHHFKGVIYFEYEEVETTDVLEEIDFIILELDINYNYEISKQIDIFLRKQHNKSDRLIISLFNHDEIYVSKQLRNSHLIDVFAKNILNEDEYINTFYPLFRLQHLMRELDSYVQELESSSIPVLQTVSNTTMTQTSSQKTYSSERMNDVRFTQTEQISAVEFMATLDSGIIDKVESLIEQTDVFISKIYDLEDSNECNKSIEILHLFSPSIAEVSILIDSLLTFDVTARAFSNLNTFLLSITVEQIADIDKKQMLCSMLLAVISDLEKWINVVFIEHTTENIHYFDASFSSNILEIENIFVEESDDDDDDDLEFF